MANEIITMFGRSIEYDLSLIYGAFSPQGQYGTIPVRRTINGFRVTGDRAQFLEFLDHQLRALRDYSADGDLLASLVDEGVLAVAGDPGPRRDVRREIQNTLDLFEKISAALKH